MNAPLKHTILAMATAALGFTAACGGKSSDDANDPSVEQSTGGELTEAEGEGSCGEGSCGEGSCG
ncbi:MAG: hypothetical protein GXY23_03095, partial [Myxococcales bacterium]|nr:hypothetical protein [Myxococcales bacterium]